MNAKEIGLELGHVSKHIKVEDYVARYVTVESDTQVYGKKAEGEMVAQGRVTNVSNAIIDDLVIDVSYYDDRDRFLGLDKSSFFDIDEIDQGQTIPFELELEIPEDTEKCVLNVAAKKMPSGAFWRWFYQGK